MRTIFEGGKAICSGFSAEKNRLYEVESTGESFRSGRCTQMVFKDKESRSLGLPFCKIGSGNRLARAVFFGVQKLLEIYFMK